MSKNHRHYVHLCTVVRQDLSRLGCGTQSGLWESGGGVQQKPTCRRLIFRGKTRRGNEVTPRPGRGGWKKNSARDGWIPLNTKWRARLRLAFQGKWKEGRGGESLVTRAVFVAAAGMSVYGLWAVGTVRRSPPGVSPPRPSPRASTTHSFFLRTM